VNRIFSLGSALAFGLGVLAIGTLPPPPVARAEGEPVWLDSYEAGQAAARQSGKPVFLVFR
jgi:hypothetical protein